MKIQNNYNLSELNTLGLSVSAKFFVEIESENEFKELLLLEEFKNNKRIFLGGGSNVLFTKDFDGIVILNKIKGIEILKENSTEVFIRAMGGEKWHDLVSFSVDRGYWGIENLSFIPGTVGAAPIQNIGAYGAELKDVLENVEAYNVEDRNKRIFNKEECALGYRESVFKNTLKNKYFILSVTLKLSKAEKRNIGYKFLQEYLEKNKIEVKIPKDISNAIMEIRKNKLPDPKVIGNAGSFFKNVFIKREKMLEMVKVYPEMPFFEEDGAIKVPAGWLIEQCRWKGKRVGNVGVHDKQALILVNYGGATGEEMMAFAEQIISSVREKFGFELIPEVNLI